MTRKISDWGGNIAALVIVIAVNAVANILPLAGRTTGAVSAKYPSLFTPAGFTFSIWSLIYVALAVFAVYQALPGQRGDAALARVGPWFKAGCAANVLWIFAWHFEWITVSLLLMLLLLASLVRVYQLLGTGGPWPVQLPFSIYLGWISVATLANVSAVQTALGWNHLALEEVSWTLLKLAVAGCVAAIVTLRRRDVSFGLVVAWAAFGIGAGQAATPAVAGAAFMLCMVALGLASFAVLTRVTSR